MIATPNSFARRFFLTVATIVLTALTASVASATDKLVYSFAGSPGPSQPDFGLTAFGDGLLYGVSRSGGSKGKGTIYRVLPRAGHLPAGFQVIYNFKGGGFGEQPNGALVADPTGNLYGVAVVGGAMADCGGLGCGVVFELVRPLAQGPWAYKVLWRFHHALGTSPVGRLALDSAGNLYGATQFGGPDNYCTGDRGGCGVIYQLSPPATDGDPWTYTVLHKFAHTMGAVPAGGLTFNDNHTALYGSTSGGGTSPLDGLVFRLLTPLPGKAAWRYQVLYNFQGVLNGDGSQPNGDLAVVGDSLVYGTTQFGGTTNLGVCASGCGTVFRVQKLGSMWVKTDIHKFTGGSDGRTPKSGLIFNGSAHYVGTTQYGGSAGCGIGCGTVFSITGGGSYLRWLSFPDVTTPNDGFQPTVGPLFRDGSIFYAVTPGGGVSSQGAVVSFSTTPPP